MISAVVITKNEETNIARCLESLKYVADEIIVLDSGSTDKTADIANSLGATVVQTEWKGYAQTKNYGNSLAQNAYILSLDADEEISKELEVAILREKRIGLRGAYRFDRRNYYGSRWIKTCGWYPDRKIRLFHNDEASWRGDFVHEQLIVKDGIKISDLPGSLNHYSIRDRYHHRQTVEKYARLAAQRILDQGKKPSRLKGMLSACTAFFQKFILKKGFLDGALGYSISLQSARSKWLRQIYAREELNKKSR